MHIAMRIFFFSVSSHSSDTDEASSYLANEERSQQLKQTSKVVMTLGWVCIVGTLLRRLSIFVDFLRDSLPKFFRAFIGP